MFQTGQRICGSCWPAFRNTACICSATRRSNVWWPQALKTGKTYSIKTVDEFRFAWEDKSFSLGVSIGMVPIQASSGSLAATMSAADNACSRAKEQGETEFTSIAK